MKWFTPYPKATYFVSIQGAGCNVIKNCEPFVCRPLLAIPTIPLLAWGMEKSSSVNEKENKSEAEIHACDCVHAYEPERHRLSTQGYRVYFFLVMQCSRKIARHPSKHHSAGSNSRSLIHDHSHYLGYNTKPGDKHYTIIQIIAQKVTTLDNAVKPVFNRSHIKWTPAQVPKFSSHVYCKINLHSADTFVKQTWTPILSHFVTQNLQ